MNFEQLKLRMFAVENTVQRSPAQPHEDADAILVSVIQALVNYVPEQEQRDNLVDLLSAYNRASMHFWYA